MADPVEVLVGPDIGEIKLGDTVLPGAYQRMEIRRSVRMDEARAPGKSGASKQPLGFEDAEVSLVLLLWSEELSTADQKLAVLVGLFQSQDRLARPFVYTITHPRLAVWGIRQVVFTELSTSDDNESDLIECTLTFKEFRPAMLRRAEARRQRTAAADTPYMGPIYLDISRNPFMHSVPEHELYDFLEYGTGEATGFTGRLAEAVQRVKKNAELGKYSAAKDEDSPSGGGG